jgi:predicted phage terminase large subunit-like protein
MTNSTSSKLSPAEWLATPDARIGIDRERCKRGLVQFVRRAWHVIEPERAYVHNWHIDAVCAHLEAITRGEINRLLINVPPGTAKSLLVSVMWPAWEWGPAEKPANRFLSTAFNDKPVTRDTRKTRDLILSEWYRQRWPEVRLTRIAETSFANSKTGTREGVAFGSLTSQRGDRLLIDDPHSTDTAESEAERAATTRRFREGAQNRLNDLQQSAIVVIMQRLHEEDVSGIILGLGLPYEHLCLPMEFEPDRACVTRWFIDPRKRDGELLFPALFPPQALADQKRAQGEYSWAGQYQQRPAPREGGLFKAERIEIVDALPAGITAWCRAWDLAGTEGAGAYTAGVLMGKHPGGYIIAHVAREQFSPGKVQSLIADTAASDGKAVKIRLPEDPGQASKTQSLIYRKLLDGYIVRIEPVIGNKELRATPFAVQVEGGRVQMLKGPWNDPLLAELRLFPSGKYKDQVDAAADAYGDLLGARAPALHIPQTVKLAAPMFGGT